MPDRREFLRQMSVLALAAAAPLGGCANAAVSRPREVLLIRHGEEPDKGIDLNEQGRRRAAALAGLFSSRFAPPRFLFAARPTSHTRRSVETLEPLAASLKLHIDDTFDDQEFALLARALTHPTYDRANVLVCWQHATLPELAHALGVAKPPRWADKNYDRIWQITYGPQGAALSDLAQALLPEDSR